MNTLDADKLTKSAIAEKLGISRPTLDTYLKNGLPKKIIEHTNLQNVDLEGLELELIKLKAQVEEKKLRIKYLNKEINLIENQIKEIEKEMEKRNENKEISND